MSSMLASVWYLDECGLEIDAVPLVVDRLNAASSRIIGVPSVAVDGVVLFACMAKVW